MAKYKDYPVYTYDEPATYSDFSGGINTDPSNEHLLPNEMRDCLNMHYSSAALVKRKGASLLCNISCEDELYNVQGVFLFTYRITYIIIAADGKLYKGFYSPNATIKLERLPITSSVVDSFDIYNPLDTNTGLEERLEESLNEHHEGFIYTYTIDNAGKRVSISDNFIGEYNKLPNNIQIKIGDIVEFYGTKYKSLINVTLNKIYPDSSDKWISLDDYNTKYAASIITKTDPLSTLYKHLVSTEQHLELINDKWTCDNPGIWEEKYTQWHYGNAVNYKNTIYICMSAHYNYSEIPSETSDNWSKIYIKKELLFQNYKKIEAATYKNKMYIATGTRFIQLEILDNELKASVVTPYMCNTEEIINIGYNYLSPYPELCRVTQYNQAITSIGGLLVIKQAIDSKFKLKPIMTFANNETEQDYYFKWEKKIGTEWYVLYSYKDNITTLANGETIKQNLFTIEVDDADQYQYRVSFAKSFEETTDTKGPWDYYASYKKEDKVSITNSQGKVLVYKCVKDHSPQQIIWDNIDYNTVIVADESAGLYRKIYETDSNGNYIPINVVPTFNTHTTTRTGNILYTTTEEGNYVLYSSDTQTISMGETYWELDESTESIIRENGKIDSDLIIDKVDGEYFGSSISIIHSDIDVEDTYKIIQSCTKIVSDGNKFLLYGDKYNSGSWYKTIIDNPSYITNRGSLSFKTNKNEELIKVIPFNGNIIAFANAENIGGSIHMVTGNGDDWDDSSGYYSPYRRTTINSSISCDNANTVQVCENILVFKYFDTLYYISGSELTNEVVSVYSCNDKIKHNNNFIRIPWDDNSCISEVTEDYYALLWKEKYMIENGELVLERPALKVKMYYKLGSQQNEKIVYPWLRDESNYFNVDYIVYIKGKPIYLYNNTLTTFHNNVYTDFNNNYICQVHFRGEDLNYPKMSKLITNVLVYYHRNQYSIIDFDLLVKNEAGHSLIDTASKRKSIQDLRALKAGDTIIDNETRLDSTILDSKVFNTTYKFPLLLADTIITSENDKEFSISSITYNYVTSETPDTTPYDLYTNILRPQETRESLGVLLKQSILETKVTKSEEIQKAIKGIKLTTETKEGKAQMQTSLEINIGGKTEYLPLALFVYDKEAKALRLNTKKEDK